MRSVWNTLVLVAIMAPLAGSDAAHAQQPTAAMEPGRRALEFELPDAGGSSFGMWWVRTPRTHLGVHIAGSVSRSTISTDAGSDTQSGWSVHAGPSMKRLFASDGSVVPFFRGDAFVGLAGNSGSDGTPLSAGVAGAIGVDWFPVSRVSVGGHTGVSASASRLTTTTPQGVELRRSQYALTTFRSGLRATVYF